MKLKTLWQSLIASLKKLFNCSEDSPHQESGSTGEESTSSTKVKAVVVGVENGWAGSCPGALKDATRMADLLAPYAEVTTLLDSAASAKNVKAAIKDAVDTSELAIIFYSGHGGQSNMGDSSEEDGKDEFLCLYDTSLLDNDIWRLIKDGKRVFLICDCCHSKTMYRTATMPVSMKMKAIGMFKAANADEENYTSSILCWSGCPDDTYSYGDANGGQLTNAILRHFDKNMTYIGLWKDVKADKTVQKFQDPQMVMIGERFDNCKIFKY